jgi:hypothetical protein
MALGIPKPGDQELRAHVEDGVACPARIQQQSD